MKKQIHAKSLTRESLAKIFRFLFTEVNIASPEISLCMFTTKDGTTHVSADQVTYLSDGGTAFRPLHKGFRMDKDGKITIIYSKGNESSCEPRLEILDKYIERELTNG